MVQRIRMAARIERDRRTPVSIAVPVRARPCAPACVCLRARRRLLRANACALERERTRDTFMQHFGHREQTCNAQH